MQKTPKPRSPRRRSAPPAPVPPPPPEPDPGAASTLRVFLEVLRLPLRPARGATELVTRFAFWIISLGGVISVTVGTAGLTIMDKIVDLLSLLVLLGVIDQWFMVPLLRSLGKLRRWLARRFPRG